MSQRANTHLLILARHSSPSPSPASYKWKHWTNEFQEPSFMHLHISFPGVCPSDSHWKRWTPNWRTKHNLRWISSQSIHSTLTDQLSQMNLGNQAWPADRFHLTHIVLCCIRNCSLLSSDQAWCKWFSFYVYRTFVFWLYPHVSWPCYKAVRWTHWANCTYAYCLSVRTESWVLPGLETLWFVPVNITFQNEGCGPS